MANFTIPADFNPQTIEKLSKGNENWDFPVNEVYGSLNPSVFGSGRAGSVIKFTKFNDLKKYLQVCKENSIDFNYTLNFSCIGNAEFTKKGKSTLLKFIRELVTAGVTQVTTVLPSVVELLNKYAPEVSVNVSVISDVDSISKLNAYLETKNVSKVILPECMNRRISRIERMVEVAKSKGRKVGTIINSACLVDCPFRSFHYSFNSHAAAKESFRPADYYLSRCTLMKLKQPTEVLRMGWIRPEDIRKYVNLGIDSFKIGGREMTKPDFYKVIDIYNKGTFDGNLWELLRCFSGDPSDLMYSKMFYLDNKALGSFTEKFFVAKSLCSMNCDSCSYCESFKDIVKINDSEKWEQRFQEELKQL
jgi:collagenase-like PrtC family protease